MPEPNRYLEIDVTDNVATVLLHRPEKRNALSPEVLTEIGGTFTDLGQREEVRVIVFTGGDKTFSAGFDLQFVGTIEKEHNERFIEVFHRAYRSILFCPVPVIAAIGGPAIAGGFDLTMMCDVRYAARRAKFGQREVPLSLTPLLDPLWRIIGLGRALEVTLTGRIYGAEEAERMGYVNAVFEDDELLDRVAEIARTMAGYDRKTLVETKATAQAVLNQDLSTAMRTQEWLFRSYIGSEDNRARVAALLEQLKRK
ncbi:MAG: enoyl-CoA hydratase/isomerase family protein [Desulfatibacillaceae bacterium]